MKIQPINQRILYILILISLFLPAIAGFKFATPGAFAGAIIDPMQLDRLSGDAKIFEPAAILEDFQKGATETAIIVTLRPTATADALVAQSQLSAQVPDAFNRPGAPPFYDLGNLDIRTQLRDTVTDEVERIISQLSVPGLTVTQRFSYQFGFAARVTPDALELIVDHPSVIRVEKDWELEPHLRQGIPLMSADVPRLSYNGSGISIAICDTGIDSSHPRLGGGGNPIFNDKVIGGRDTGDNDNDPRPHPTLGNAHGTASAGVAAGDLDSVGDYIGGVAPGAKLYDLKISIGNGGSASSSSMIAAWEWAVTHQNDDFNNPIMIINTSFGGGQFSSACDSVAQAMTTAAANAVAAGITLFVSSGNDGYCDSMGWPACISFVNSVGAVYDDNIGQPGFCVAAESCANKQPHSGCPTGWAAFESSTAADQVTAYSNSASFLTFFAPSHNAYTTDIVGSGGYTSGDYFDSYGGTSAASPYAAGAAAVLQSAAKALTGNYLTPDEVRRYLTTYGDLITDGKVAVTKPRINVARAIDALTPSSNLPDLVVTSVTSPASGEAGGEIFVSVSVENRGDAAAGAFWTGLYLSTDASITPSDIDTEWGLNSTGLAAGERISASGSIPLPSTLTPGTYYFGAYADSKNQVTESDETNNGRAAANTITISNDTVTAGLPEDILAGLFRAYFLRAPDVGGWANYIAKLSTSSDLLVTLRQEISNGDFIKNPYAQRIYDSMDEVEFVRAIYDYVLRGTGAEQPSDLEINGWVNYIGNGNSRGGMVYQFLYDALTIDFNQPPPPGFTQEQWDAGKLRQDTIKNSNLVAAAFRELGSSTNVASADWRTWDNDPAFRASQRIIGGVTFSGDVADNAVNFLRTRAATSADPMAAINDASFWEIFGY